VMGLSYVALLLQLPLLLLEHGSSLR
jgi:hypothetical protein